MDDSFLKFEFFLDFYKSSMMWNKILFLDHKIGFVSKRRSLMVNGVISNTEYKLICLKIQQADETCLQDILDAMLNRISMENDEF